MNNALSVNEVLDEVARILTDARGYLAQAPDRVGEAMARADIDARTRYLQRVKVGGPPERDPEIVAVHIASWLVEHADLPSPRLSLDAALAAAERRTPGNPLARDLVELVSGYVTGEISDEELARRELKPRGPGRRRRGFTPPPRPAGAIAVSSAERALRTMLAEAGVDGAVTDPGAAWQVFKAFASRPVAGDPPTHLVSDDFLFQWYLDASGAGGGERIVVDFTRQFTISDEDGDYDHMEQLRCAFAFEPTPGLAEVGVGALWSAGAMEDWIAQAEQSAGFSMLSSGRPADVRIEQGPV
jgi:hypothetical protein